MRQSHIFVLMVVIPLVFSQSARGNDCVCELQNSDLAFPENKLNNVEFTAIQCIRNVTSEKMTEIDRLVLGLQHRIRQLLENVSMLEREDNGNLYAAVSLRIIELELAEIQDLLDKLNRTTNSYHQQSVQTAAELQDMEETMTELEKFDHMQVMTKQRENEIIKRDLERCKEELNKNMSSSPHERPVTGGSTSYSFSFQYDGSGSSGIDGSDIDGIRDELQQHQFKLDTGYCGLSRMVNVLGLKTYSLTEYGTSYSFGAWGRDANPAPGDENKYWLVVLTSSNAYGNFIRQYNSLSTIMLGIAPTDTYISSSNPTTNTIQGSNMVMYGNALYYNCYNTYSVCQFNMTTRAVSTVALPSDTGYNSKFPFGHLGTTYSYTDMDFATDESGIYVIYATTSKFGNVVISKIETSNPPVLGQTWSTSLHKKTVTNTFMVCGVLYATRYLDKEKEQIFYSYDTKTKKERYDLKFNIKKMKTNVQFLNYDPRDHLLYVYSDAYISTYELVFQ